MNERNLRPGNVSAAAVVIGGLLLIVFPEHAPSIVQVVIATVAASFGLHTLAARVPATGWLSPFKWMSPFGRSPERESGRHADELALLRARLSGWRQRVPGGTPLPPATVALVGPLIGRTLEVEEGRRGPFTRDRSPDAAVPGRSQGASVRERPRDAADLDRLSRETRAVLAAEPRKGLRWFPRIPPNRDAVADAVNQVLDDLEPSGYP